MTDESVGCGNSNGDSWSIILLTAVLLAGCAAPIPADSTSPSPVSPDAAPSLDAQWELLRTLSFYEIPESSLKGDLETFRPYMVTMAGFETELFGLTVGPDDDVRFTRDGGATWTKSDSALHCRWAVDIVDDRVAWHCGNGGTRRSVDGGETWQTVAESPCPYLSFLDERTGWAASPYELKATVDGGATWTALTPPAPFGEIAGLSRRTLQDGYLLDASGALHVTADGGITWERRSIGLAEGERIPVGREGVKAVVRFLDAAHGLVVYDLLDRSVWSAVTADGGRTWQRTEISLLRDRSYFYYLHLSRNGRLLTATDNFNNGRNVSLLFTLRG